MLDKNRLIILTGPSCAGKTPLERSLRHLYPEIDKKLRRLVAYNSRAMRPVETEGIDYYFRSTDQIQQLARQNKIVLIEARGDLHGFDMDELQNILKHSDAFYEGNTFMASKMHSLGSSQNFPVLSIFLSPFSQSEMEQLIKKFTIPELKDHIYNHMLQKLIRRADNFEINMTDKILNNLKDRARDAYQELSIAHSFDHIIVNHDGEDSSNWHDPDNLQGDAITSVHSLAGLIIAGNDPNSENWEGLLF